MEATWLHSTARQIINTFRLSSDILLLISSLSCSVSGGGFLQVHTSITPSLAQLEYAAFSRAIVIFRESGGHLPLMNLGAHTHTVIGLGRNDWIIP